MDINHVKEGEISIITINGQLDADTAPVADKTIKPILEENCLRMLFDFSALDISAVAAYELFWGRPRN